MFVLGKESRDNLYRVHRELILVTGLAITRTEVDFGVFDGVRTLAEQEAELAANPLLQRLHAARQGYADDPHRPIYHYVNPESTLNDPNGLCFWQGRWHLFYQAYPPEDPRQHWGHAVSDDLIHWRDLPYAIYPNPSLRS